MTGHSGQPRGRALLSDPLRNKGVAFTQAERERHGLVGMLPPAVLTLDQQASRAYAQVRGQPDDLARNTYLEQLHDRNEVLYYRLLADHLAELLPVVYDPTVSQAIKRYSHEYRWPRGVFLCIDRPAEIRPAFEALKLGADDVDLVVATDAEQILGIGDWGVGGVRISVGKLAVYTAAAGIHPARGIPVVLDVGTDNQELLNDPLYVGHRHARVRGAAYDEFVAAYVDAVSELFPRALLHWEDFGPGNARRILRTYGDRVCTFNDDMQGTGAITLAAVLSGLRVTGAALREQRVLVFGAGTAGVGIADQLRDAMVRDGLDQDAATRRIWCVDRQGLLVDSMSDLRDYQVPYARPAREVSEWDGALTDLAAVVDRVRPTVLVGTSTSAGAFTEQVVTGMARHVERPIVLPLSNPTEKIEAMPADVLSWTGGRALVAAGIPVPPVTLDGTTHVIGQANNALVYPGLGLGTVVARASRVTDGMLQAAAEAITGLADVSAPGAPLLPEVANLRVSSATVAVAVAERAARDGVARADVDNLVQRVHDAMWQPVYPDESDGTG
ncbi:NAD-dependent malic enzyme [Goodfellowiella coeruleoviolacea]|uniref:Putative malate oxidoreductase [NAD] n=1 Tax=Goodfellowiella coeruleoviolacea TaxID=334858 RepID=A0AAE3KJS9_9PSEU|nr:NAD-dependent malic enzyme [Goodfellowiella coeruleoviolacea]MCP2169417.1 malate dehydrogenase (oxaloacetate-decarboxylating) [Goodfellowiella coeruleoviolacea]